MLDMKDVTRTYAGRHGEVVAVRDVSLAADASELVAVQGPSGCGKTTLLMMGGALLRPTEGTVLVAGTDPYALSPNERSAFRAQNIGFVFQQFHLVPYLTVLQNVLTPNTPNPRPDPQGRALELIRHFRLEHRVHHLPSELSAGERQRVALARALFNEPGLVLADEPTGNLDPANAETVLQALRDYAQNGGSVLLVTHDPMAAERADRILRLDEGCLVGTPDSPTTKARTQG